MIYKFYDTTPFGQQLCFATYYAVELVKHQSKIIYSRQGKHNSRGESAFARRQVSVMIRSSIESQDAPVDALVCADGEEFFLERSDVNVYYNIVSDLYTYAMPDKYYEYRNKLTGPLYTFGYWRMSRNHLGSWVCQYNHHCYTATPTNISGVLARWSTVLREQSGDSWRDVLRKAQTLLRSATIRDVSRIQNYSGDRFSSTLVEPPFPQAYFDEKLLEDMCQLYPTLVSTKAERDAVFGRALLSVVENAQYTDVVNLENIVQLIESIRNLPQLPSSIAKMTSALSQSGLKSKLKLASDAKLSYDYSYRTTLSDVRSIADSIRKGVRFGENLARGRHNAVFHGQIGDFGVNYRLEHSYKVWYGSTDESLLPLYRKIQNIGLDPSFEHIWNLIPYSFVADWLYPISELWSQIDYNTSIATLPIHAVTHGKWETLSLTKDGLQVDISTFNRDLASDLPDFPFFLPDVRPCVNWWNAGALILQRVR